MLTDVTIFDFETTGLDPMKERVVEMAALRIRDGVVIGSFQTLVHQTQPIHPKAKAAHGIEEADLVNAMDETLAFKILRNVMGDSLLVAHNAAFDLQYLHWAMMRIGNKTFSNNFIDTMTIARERYPYPHTLGGLCERLGIVLEGAHRAMNDVYGCWEILQKMHAEEPVDSWVNRLGYLRKYAPPAWAPDHAKVFGTDNRYEPRAGATG